VEREVCGLPVANVSHLLKPSKVLLRLPCLLMPLPILPLPLPLSLGVLKKDQSDAGSVLVSLCAVDVLGDADMSRFIWGSAITTGICVSPPGCPVVPNHRDSSMSFSIFQSISATCLIKGSRSTDCGEILFIQNGILGMRSDRYDLRHSHLKDSWAGKRFHMQETLTCHSLAMTPAKVSAVFPCLASGQVAVYVFPSQNVGDGFTKYFLRSNLLLKSEFDAAAALRQRDNCLALCEARLAFRPSRRRGSLGTINHAIATCLGGIGKRRRRKNVSYSRMSFLFQCTSFQKSRYLYHGEIVVQMLTRQGLVASGSRRRERRERVDPWHNTLIHSRFERNRRSRLAGARVQSQGGSW
jgi:hypothetical protein